MKSFKDLNSYIDAALANARYEEIDGGAKIYAEIPEFVGVWASGSSREESSAELRKALEGWIDLQLERNNALPDINGIRPPAVSFA